MEPLRTEGFLLRWRDLGLGDRWLTWFTRDLGLTRVLAARRMVEEDPELRFPVSLDRGVLLLLERRRQPGHRLVDYALAERNVWLAGDLERLGGAMLLADTLEGLSAEDDPQPEAYDVLAAFLGELRGPADPRSLTTWGMLRLMTVLGYGLAFDACRACGGAPSGKGFFVAPKGGFLHARCAGRSAGLPVSAGTLVFLRKLSGATPSVARRMRGDTLVAKETESVLAAHLACLCQRRLRAQEFLGKVALLRSGPARGGRASRTGGGSPPPATSGG